MSIKRNLAIGTTLASLSGAMLFISPIAAHAYVPGAPPCDGSSCVGETPYYANQNGSCANDATTVTGSVVTTPGSRWTVELRWSAFCEANWAKLDGGPAAPLYSIYYVETADGHEEWGSGGWYSNMVNGKEKARVCVYDEGASDDTWVCSAYF